MRHFTERNLRNARSGQSGRRRLAGRLAIWIGLYVRAGPAASLLIGALHETADLDFPCWDIENKFIRMAPT